MSEYQRSRIFESWFRDNTLLDHQLNSFNNFILQEIPEILSQEQLQFFSGKQPYVLEMINPEFKSPTLAPNILMYPEDARNFNTTYSGTLLCDLRETKYEDGKQVIVTHYKVPVCQIPVMTRSIVCNLYRASKSSLIKHNECLSDQGGVFVINGNDRLLTSQIRIAYNIPLVHSHPEEKYYYVAETRSMSNATGHSVLSKVFLTKDNRSVLIALPRLKDHIPVGLIFKALGFTNFQDIENMIGMGNKVIINHTNVIEFINWNSASVQTQDEAIAEIQKHTKDVNSTLISTKQIIDNDIFPHLGIASTALEKACFLAYIISKLLLTASQKRAVDDRDSLTNKRIETAGTLCASLFSPLLKKALTALKESLESKEQIVSIVNSFTKETKIITKGFHQCFGTGNWGLPNTAYIRPGVSQLRDCMTWGATLSIARRIINPIRTDGSNNASIHQIHPSHWGFIDPYETPEGKKAGVVSNIALFATITTKAPFIVVRQILETKCKKLSPINTFPISEIPSATRVFLNGVIIGFSTTPDLLVRNVHNRRNKAELPSQLSASFNIEENIVQIFCDEGRLIRPLLTVYQEENKEAPNSIFLSLDIDEKESEFDWKELVSSKAIQYVDVYEQEQAYIAMYPDRLNNPDYRSEIFTHCEIRPDTILGVISSIIPWPDHSQSPRNTYQASMAKQSIGVPFLNYQRRYDTLKVMFYPQKPIVSTLASRCIGYSDMPSGFNAVVAIMTYGGWNQEDSVILNQSAIDRGMLLTSVLFTISETDKPEDSTATQTFCIPPESNKIKGDPSYFERKFANYSALDSSGFIKKGTRVKKGDVVIGKIHTTSTKSSSEASIKDVSRVIAEDEEGTVQRVDVFSTPSGYKIVNVVISQMRFPIIGNKVASRSGQKGTIGMTFRQEDMPYTSDGIVPDIILNPNAFPSRMTIAQLCESALGKWCAIEGEYGDCSPFTEDSHTIGDTIPNKLHSVKHSKRGTETMYCGFTGEPIESQICVGVTMYQCLKHMVEEKCHVRTTGRYTSYTRQPVEGRAREGGMRWGEMERDVGLGRATIAMIKERLCDVSDPFSIPVCTSCKTIANTKECGICGSSKIKQHNIPFASKLFLQLLGGMGFKLAIHS